MYFVFFTMTAETILKPIADPARLRPGAVLVRCHKAGEEVEERWQVVRWQTPMTPAAGEAWGSGFLSMVSLDAHNYGEALQVGPRKAVIRDFCQCVESDSEPDGVTKKEARRSYWWNRDD